MFGLSLQYLDVQCAPSELIQVRVTFSVDLATRAIMLSYISLGVKLPLDGPLSLASSNRGDDRAKEVKVRGGEFSRYNGERKVEYEKIRHLAC